MSLVNLTYGAESSDVELNITINQKGMLSLNSFLHKESSDYYMQVAIAFDEKDDGKFESIFLNKTVDICKFLSTPSYETLLQIYYKAVLKYENNLPTQCPIGGKVSRFLFYLSYWLIKRFFCQTYYYIRNLDLTVMSIPPYLPGSNAYIHIYFLLKENNEQFKYLSGGKSFLNFKKL